MLINLIFEWGAHAKDGFREGTVSNDVFRMGFEWVSGQLLRRIKSTSKYGPLRK